MACSKPSMEAPVRQVRQGEAGEGGRGQSGQDTGAPVSSSDFILSGMGDLLDFEKLCKR